MFSEDGEPPWPRLSPFKISEGVCERELLPARHRGPIPVSWGLTDDVWKLIESCWRLDPKERPTAVEVLHRLTTALIDYNAIHGEEAGDPVSRTPV